jgi:hypothetical protein
MATMALREQQAINAFDPSRRFVLPLKADAFSLECSTSHARFSANTFLTDTIMPNMSRAIQTAAQNQTLVNEALLACALERHQLVYGCYPETLHCLVPEFLPQVPPDIIAGHSLKYHLTEDGQYVLYSVGWNATDERGVPGTKGVARFDVEKGDWVWPYRQKLRNW